MLVVRPKPAVLVQLACTRRFPIEHHTVLDVKEIDGACEIAADSDALFDEEALALAKRLADGLERQDAYRSGQARYPVP